MKVVLDTNVLIAAFVARGTCADLLEHCAREHKLVTSETLLAEFQRVLTEKFGQRAIDARAAVDLLRTKCRVVEPAPLDPGACRDQDDVVVLGTAVAGDCAVIVSGDHDLRSLGQFRTIAIVTPGEFWKLDAEVAP